MPRTHPAPTALLVAAALLLSCATNPVTGRREIVLMSEEQEVEVGRRAARDVESEIGYVDHMILQREKPETFLIATGEAHSVRDLCELAFRLVDLDYREYVDVDPRYFRPSEVEHLCGDATKAREQLGWRPEVDFHGLVKMMVDADMRLAEREQVLREVVG